MVINTATVEHDAYKVEYNTDDNIDIKIINKMVEKETQLI